MFYFQKNTTMEQCQEKQFVDISKHIETLLHLSMVTREATGLIKLATNLVAYPNHVVPGCSSPSYTSSKLSGEIATIQLMVYCQACSRQFFWHMEHKFQSRKWDLLLLADAIAALHYQYLTLEGKKDCITLYIYTHINHIYHFQEVFASSS